MPSTNTVTADVAHTFDYLDSCKIDELAVETLTLPHMPRSPRVRTHRTQREKAN